jgi:hypothetical protein
MMIASLSRILLALTILAQLSVPVGAIGYRQAGAPFSMISACCNEGACTCCSGAPGDQTDRSAGSPFGRICVCASPALPGAQSDVPRLENVLALVSLTPNTLPLVVCGTAPTPNDVQVCSSYASSLFHPPRIAVIAPV